MAVFSQHHVDGLDLTVNPLLYMMRCFPVSSSIMIFCGDEMLDLVEHDVHLVG